MVIDGFAQGTTYHIAYHSTSGQLVTKYQIDSLLASFDNSCSLYNPNSLISALNTNKTDSLDKYILESIEFAKFLNTESDGLYDITVKPLIKAYGFLDNKANESKINIDSILNFVGMSKITVAGNRLIKQNPNTEIDLNSIAQGYSVDLLAKFMESKGINNYIVELGGEIFSKGENTGEGWKVGIDRPVDNSYVAGSDVQAIIVLHDKGLTTSGNYRKFFKLKSGERINHTINPKTGESSQNEMLSATVVAPTALIADGYTTTFMLMGLQKSIQYVEKHPELEAMFVYSQNDSIKTYISPNLKKSIKILK